MAQLFDIRKVTVGPRNLEAVVEVAPSAPLMTSDDAEGTGRVLSLMPELADHVCLGDSAPRFGDVIEDTELAHLLEHVTVELLARTDIAGDILSGQTVELGERLYMITLVCPDDVLVAGALSSAVWILQWAYSGGGDPQPDVEAIAGGLVGLVESLEDGEKDEPAEPEDVDEDVDASEDDLDLDEVFHALDHPLDDHRVVVLDAGIDPLQAQGVEVLALTLGGTDAAFDLGDFQSCHFLKN